MGGIRSADREHLPDYAEPVSRVSRLPMAFSDPLFRSVGWSVRPLPTVEPFESLEHAAHYLGDHDLVAVVRDGRYVGVLDQTSLARALGHGVDPRAAVEGHYVEVEPLSPADTGAGALRQFETLGRPVLPVVDGLGRPIGLLAASDLMAPREQRLRPRAIGGMATPFGVYLTTGTLRAGVNDWALMSTGALLFLLLAGASIGVDLAGMALWERFGDRPFWSYGVHALAWGPVLLFLVAMRSLPLAGIHGAEHQVVHAIERGERLDYDIVRRMPRVHPRCGTNYAAAMALFVGLASWNFLPDIQLRVLLAAVVTLALWRPLGALLQYWVTTRPPARKHVEMAIQSGEELLGKVRSRIEPRPTLWRRLYCAGVLQVMLGAGLTYAVVAGIASRFGYIL